MAWTGCIVLSIIVFSCAKKMSAPKTSEIPAKEVLLSKFSQDIAAKSNRIRMVGTVKVDQWPRARMELRIIPDSIIWYSVRFLGFEISRGTFQRDSVFVIDKYNQEYWKGAYEDFRSFTKVPLRYGLVQDLILNRALPRGFSITEMNPTANGYITTANDDNLNLKFTVETEDYALLDSKFYSAQRSETMYAQANEYKTYDNNIYFPYFRQYIIKNNNIKEAEVEIKTQEIQTDVQFSLPFSVPYGYTLAN